jgi:hypothetical protein
MNDGSDISSRFLCGMGRVMHRPSAFAELAEPAEMHVAHISSCDIVWFMSHR